MSAHRATLDYVSRPVEACSAGGGQWGRCEQNRFAEEQGLLGLRWLDLQETLNARVRESAAQKRLYIYTHIYLFI